MPKGRFPFLTVRDLQDRLTSDFEKVGRKPPSRPTLYRLEERGVWKATKAGANNWRMFSEEDLNQSAQNILKYYAIV